MKKLAAVCLSAVISVFFVFAGDSAVLVEKGFSEDGNYFIFGQYGKTDRSFQGWAELYTVDLDENDYAEGGVFKVSPGENTSSKSGLQVFEELEGKSYYFTRKYNAAPAEADQILYIREDESKSASEEIVFKDFTKSISSERSDYHVRLFPTYEGKGASSKSSFFIMIEKRDSLGNVVASQKVGTPSIKRSGVTGYKIERIECNKSGTKLVFLVEKKVEDKTGVNIRYMIEACVLNPDFINPPYDK